MTLRSHTALPAVIFITLLSLAACDRGNPAGESAPPKAADRGTEEKPALPEGKTLGPGVVATVNGEVITDAVYADHLAAAAFMAKHASFEGRMEVLQSLADRMVVIQDARARGMGERPMIRQMIDRQLRRLVYGGVVRKIVESVPPVEEEEVDAALATPGERLDLTVILEGTGTGTISTFGYQMRFDLQDGFPLMTTKKLHLKSIIHELLWFLAGDTNTAYLNDNGVRIWNEWADEKGDLGHIYGYQWRSWPTPGGQHIDQISRVVESLRQDPDSRRHVVSAWNVGELDKMALPPCHILFQFYIAEGKLSCQLYQRSADIFLGVPFNIASYSFLLMMMAQVLGLEAGEFIHTLGDAHIYQNHLEQVKVQLDREPRTLPGVQLNPEIRSIFDFKYEDFTVENDDPHPHIKGTISV